LKRNGLVHIIAIKSPSHEACYHNLQAGQLRRCGLIYGKGMSYFSNLEHPDQFWGLFSIIFSGTEGEAAKV
jgi:hypothetical protein